MSTKKVAIIGSGIAGMTLAYAFQQSGLFEFTIISAKAADEVRHGRILSTQCHFESLLETEARFGIPDYGPVNEIKKIKLFANGQMMFDGRLKCRAVSQDQRIYLSTLMDVLCERGAAFEKRRLSADDLPKLAADYDLIIDCSGKAGPITTFPIYEGLSNAPAAPLRVLTCGMFRGIIPDENHTMNFNIMPGHGELFETSTMTKHGLARSLLLEAVPGSELDCIKGMKEPAQFEQEILQVLRMYFPHIYKRVNLAEFGLADPLSYTRLAIKPELHIPYTMINGTLVLGCGDSIVLNDPITGQGANAASYCANKLFDVLSANREKAWDEAIGESYWHEIKEYVTKVTEWSNAMMGPLSEAFTGMMEKATQDQETADELVNLFANPLAAYRAYFASAEMVK